MEGFNLTVMTCMGLGGSVQENMKPKSKKQYLRMSWNDLDEMITGAKIIIRTVRGQICFKPCKSVLDRYKNMQTSAEF